MGSTRAGTSARGICRVAIAALVMDLITAACGFKTGFAEEHPGQQLFEQETFGGNGRTCQSCHRQGARTISPEEARTLFASNPNDPLFQGDAADGFEGQGAQTFGRFLEHATIVVGLDLHADVSVVGSKERKVFFNRGIPTTLDTPALVSELMSDGRAPTLREQARGALAGHAQVFDVDDSVLDTIASFETTEFSRAELQAFAEGGPEPLLPVGNTESEKRGRAFFERPTTAGKEGFCGICHSGPMLNEVAADLVVPVLEDAVPLTIRAGARFSTALVSERNAIGNPQHLWLLEGQDGLPRLILSPDIGRAAITGKWENVNEFKIPQLWNARNTAPFFHDNSAKTLEQVVDHYAIFLAPGLGVVLTPQDKADIVAFLKLL